MGSPKILVTCPDYDLVTRYISTWADEVIRFAPKYSIKIIPIIFKKVKREIIEQYLKKHKFSFVWFNGHGSKNSIFGHKNEILIQQNENEELLVNKIIYSLSCESGLELGKSCVDKGAKAFIGYRLPFGFLTDKNSECSPEDDNIASIFKEPSNIIPLTLIKGKSVKTAFKRSQEKFKDLIHKYSASENMPEAPTIRLWLFWNMSSQIALGDLSAKI